jgi:hypothetical protein
VEPERFDDVAFRIVEGPEPPRRPPRAPRWALGIVAGLLAAGALAAGASALTSGDDEQARTTSKPRATERGVVLIKDDGHLCRKDEAAARAHKRQGRSSESRD